MLASLVDLGSSYNQVLESLDKKFQVLKKSLLEPKLKVVPL